MRTVNTYCSDDTQYVNPSVCVKSRCPRLRIFIVESEFSNLADIRLNHMFGGGAKIHYQESSQTLDSHNY